MKFETSEVLKRERKVVENYLELVDRVLFGGGGDGAEGVAVRERGWDKERADARRKRRGGRSSLAPVLVFKGGEGEDGEGAEATVGGTEQEDESWMNESKDTASESNRAFSLFDASTETDLFPSLSASSLRPSFQLDFAPF